MTYNKNVYDYTLTVARPDAGSDYEQKIYRRGQGNTPVQARGYTTERAAIRGGLRWIDKDLVKRARDAGVTFTGREAFGDIAIAHPDFGTLGAFNTFARAAVTALQSVLPKNGKMRLWREEDDIDPDALASVVFTPHELTELVKILKHPEEPRDNPTVWHILEAIRGRIHVSD